MTEYSTFQDTLSEQLRRAPYLVASLFAHFVIALFIAGIMILQSQEVLPPPVIVAAAPPPPPLVEDVETPELPEEPLDFQEEAVVMESMGEEVVDSPTETLGDPNQMADAPTDDRFLDNTVGLGGPPGGKFGQRGGPSGKSGSAKSERAVLSALQWLADHQSTEGYWDADQFMLYDRYPEQVASTGGGNPVNDVGISGLALLALQGHGNTQTQGKYQRHVADGITWLREVQQDNGLFGEEIGNPTLYNHAIATMAMGEAYWFSHQSPILQPNMKKAVRLILHAQNNYGGWRYNLEANGDNDTSITGWMVFALKTAQVNKLPVDQSAFAGAEAWFSSIEDKAIGRTGYAWGSDGGGVGSLPSRPVGYLERFPAEKSESLTAVALLSRMFMTHGEDVRRWRDHPQYEILQKQANLIAAKTPLWDEANGSIDMYYWYYGTYAMNQWGGALWKNWKKSLEQALLPAQRMENAEDNFHGSWNPVGVWGAEGGRVYSTALCTLILEVYYRYSLVLGAR